MKKATAKKGTKSRGEKKKAAAPAAAKPKAPQDKRVPLPVQKDSEGLVRRAILKHMDKLGASRTDVHIACGLPSTIVYEYLRKDGDVRGISLKNAEAMIAALGGTIVLPDTPSPAMAKALKGRAA